MNGGHSRVLSRQEPEVTPARGREDCWPLRQSIFFPIDDDPMVSADALTHAKATLSLLGFSVVRRENGVWQISWPGSALKVWRYSPAELCQFADDQAPRYAAAQIANADMAAETIKERE